MVMMVAMTAGLMWFMKKMPKEELAQMQSEG
jgi:hypothetical protein